VYSDGDLAEAIRTALADRDRLVTAGLERAKLFSWEETARRTLDVYREALG
jgi:D-inositol-3-phosphate glycosyltransferase